MSHLPRPPPARYRALGRAASTAYLRHHPHGPLVIFLLGGLHHPDRRTRKGETPPDTQRATAAAASDALDRAARQQLVQGEDFDKLHCFTDGAVCFFFCLAGGGRRFVGGFRLGVRFFKWAFEHERFAHFPRNIGRGVQERLERVGSDRKVYDG